MKKRRHRPACWIAAAWVAVLGSVTPCAAQAPAAPLTQEAYVWQRNWSSPLRESFRRHHASFTRLLLLASEISWRGTRPTVAVAAIDYKLLRETGAPIGLALRVGAPTDAITTNSTSFGVVAGVVAAMLSTAQKQGVMPAELQIDLDCPTSKLAGYAEWLTALRARVAPLPLTFTARPTWLDDGAFTNLAAAADGYVLQVHSLERPAGTNQPLTLCDEAAAQAAVLKADGLGRPFRVALPTYGYSVAFDAQGEFRQLMAERPRVVRRGWSTVEVHADPSAMCRLVRAWRADRPAHLTGILWYRLPHEDDRLNWAWTTLDSVMRGREPAAACAARGVRTSPGLWVIDIANHGDGDGRVTNTVRVTWSNATVVASDAFSGFVGSFPTNGVFLLQPGPGGGGLRPGETRKIAWLRLDGTGVVDAVVGADTPRGN